MKKLFVAMFVLLMGVLPMGKTVENYDEAQQVSELFIEVKMDTKFDVEDFNYSANVSRQYSEDVGLPEWIGL